MKKKFWTGRLKTILIVHLRRRDACHHKRDKRH